MRLAGQLVGDAWFSIFPNSRYEDLFVELYRVLLPARHLYVMTGIETMFVAKPIAGLPCGETGA